MFTTPGPGHCEPSTLPCQQNLAVRFGRSQDRPGAVAKIAFGQYRSPNYLKSVKDSITLGTSVRIPAVGSYSGVPQVQTNPDPLLPAELAPTKTVVVFIPSGTTPSGGWPVVIFGHGSGDTMLGSPFNVAAKMASHGLATSRIHSAMHGFGPSSTVHGHTICPRNGGPVTFSAGGRSFEPEQRRIDRFADEVSLAGGLERPPLYGRHSVSRPSLNLMQLVPRNPGRCRCRRRWRPRS